MILEPGDTAFYPQLMNMSGKPMTVKGVRRIRYPNGNRFYQYFFDGHTEDKTGLTDRLVENLKDNVDNAYDNLVVICGKEGTGKSNLAVDICKSYDPTFTLQDRYIYDFYPFLEKLEQDFKLEQGGRAYLLDEATNLVSNRDWNKDDNKHMIQLLEMFRSRGLTLVLCIPSFDRLDKYIREYRARFKLECKDLPQGDRFGGRGYYELTILQTKTTVGHGTFPIMAPEDKQIYEALKLKSQESKLQEMKAAADPENDRRGSKIRESGERNKKMAYYFVETMGWSYRDVSEQFDIPEGTLRRWIKEMREEA